MLKYIVKRVLYSILILVGVSFIIYALIRLMPADYLDTRLPTRSQTAQESQDSCWR